MSIIDKIAHALHMDKPHAEREKIMLPQATPPQPQPEPHRRVMTCSLCGGKGHTARKCPAKTNQHLHHPADESSPAGSGGDHGNSDE